MRVVPVFLAISLVANLALAWVLFFRPTSGAAGLSSERHAASKSPSPSLVSAGRVTDLAPAALRAALQQSALPPEVVNAVVLARIFSRYDARRREFLAESAKLPWWQAALMVTTGTRESLFTPAQRKELRELEATARGEALKLLGPQALDPEGTIAQRHAFVAPEKAVLLDALLRDYQALSATLKDETGGLRTAADRAQEKFLAAEQQRDLAALLSREERERYELRTSPIAARLQWRLAGFDPTEAEYRAVYAVHQTFAEQYASPVSLEGRARPYDFASMPEFQQQLREALGEARYDDWKLAAYPHVRALDRFVPELGLTPETVKQIGVLLRDTAARSWQVSENNAMESTAKRAALVELAAKARAEVTAKLGVAAAERYLRENASWLDSIATGTAINLLENGAMNYRLVDGPTRPPPRPAGSTPNQSSPPAPATRPQPRP